LSHSFDQYGCCAKGSKCGVVKGYQIVVDVIVLSTYGHVDASLRISYSDSVEFYSATIIL